MNKSIFFYFLSLIFIISLLNAFSVSAQKTEKDEFVPAPPFFSIPDYARWSVKIKYHKFPSGSKDEDSKVEKLGEELAEELGTTDKKNSVPKKPVEIIVTKTGDIIHYKMKWNNGTQTEDWHSGKYRIVENPFQKYLSVVEIGRLEIDYNQSAPDMASAKAFDWIKASHYVDTVKYKSKKCHLFESSENNDLVRKGDVYVNKGGLPVAPGVDLKGTQCWINSKTNLPVARKDHIAEYTFKFKSPPKTKLKLPARFSKAVKEYQSRSVRKY